MRKKLLKINLKIIIFIIIISLSLVSKATTNEIEIVSKTTTNEIEIVSEDTVKLGEQFTVSLDVPENTYAFEATVIVTFSDSSTETKKIVYVKNISDMKNEVTFTASVAGDAEILFSNIILCDQDSNEIETDKIKIKSIKIEKETEDVVTSLETKQVSVNSETITAIILNKNTKLDTYLTEDYFPNITSNTVKIFDKNGNEKQTSDVVGSRDIFRIIDSRK